MNQQEIGIRLDNIWTVLCIWYHQLIIGFDYLLQFIFENIEQPLQNAFYYLINRSPCRCRRRVPFLILNNITGILVQSYILTLCLYYLILPFAYLFAIAIERAYFIDPLLSVNRQCIDIQFVAIDNRIRNQSDSRLRKNFLQENSVLTNEESDYQNNEQKHNHTQLYDLFNLLHGSHYMICQRSLYIYTRFHTYSSLLHSNHSHFRFWIPYYSSSFPIDHPPFLDLCVHTANRSHLFAIETSLRSFSSRSYSSVNLFLFDFDFTQVSVTLYLRNDNSTQLERVSIHSGWLRDSYSQVNLITYTHALSTILFDGSSVWPRSVDYFGYSQVPVPADPILGLNEMIQQSLVVLPLCRHVLA